MHDLLSPVIVAPMAGGPSVPGLVRAAAHADALGFLAAGYKTPAAVEDDLRAVRGVAHGLNIFVPMAAPPDAEPLERYRRLLQAEADRYQVDLPPLRLDDDDHFAAKVELAIAYGTPLVSFTFGIPDVAVTRALREAGCAVLITVTSADEARHALAAEPNALIAQAGAAGGHASTTSPFGYQGTSVAVQALLDAGAAAVQCGTCFLLADEAGTRPAQRAAMLSGEYHETVVTRAFTGQPARGLRNRFTDMYSAAAPIGYPCVHHLTAPIRAAAAQQGDPSALNLWAGTGFAAARPGPLADLIDDLRD
jgi:nitronate monooxygenase